MPAAPTYHLKYRVYFTNENQETCLCHLSSKTDNGEVVDITAAEDAVSISRPNSDEDKFSPIRGSELKLKFPVYDSYGIGLDTFLGADDEWKVDYYKNDLSVTNWQGFLVQEEHSREMQDEPYEMELNAVDGLGLTKDKALVKADGAKFSGLNYILDYVGDILWQVNPFLDLVTHVNIFHIAMDDRDVAPEKDPWLQIKLQARSFQSDPGTFEDQYSVLEKTLISWGCFLFQWQGAWHIMDLWDIMRGETSFTTYTYNRTSPTNAHIRSVVSGQINKVFEAKIAPHADVVWSGPIEPEGEDQIMGLKFANKSVRLTYNYTPWPELPLNNKFDRGTLSIPLSGFNFSSYIVDDWEFGKATDLGGAASLPWTLATPTGNAYSKRTFDTFGVEISREIVMTLPHTSTYPGNQTNWLRSEGIPVTQGDKISISFQFKLAIAWTSINSPTPFQAYIVNEAGTAYYGLWEDSAEHGTWRLNQPGAMFLDGVSPDGNTTYMPLSTESAPIPINGTLYLVFNAFRAAELGNIGYWSDFQFTYRPFTAGGYVQVKGESWRVAQNTEYKQKSDVEIFQNDSIHGVLKGAMYRFSNVAGWILTEPRWYRYTYTETLRFSQIQALKRFWHTYRGMQKIEGSFNGLIFFTDVEVPFGMIALLWPEFLGDKKYMLTSIEENHKTGTWKGTMIEKGDLDDAGITIDTSEFNYIFGQ